MQIDLGRQPTTLFILLPSAFILFLPFTIHQSPLTNHSVESGDFALRGLDGKSEPHETMEDMASYFIRLIKQVQKQGPYHLAGYSLGAHIVFEIALQLTKEGIWRCMTTYRWDWSDKRNIKFYENNCKTGCQEVI